RLQLVSDASGMVIAGVAGPSWRVGTDEVDAYLEKFVERGPPQDHGFDFGWQRTRIATNWAHDPETGFWQHARFVNHRTYRIPDRFVDLF
ncbi:MAG: hypothetical protein ACRC14_03915, partial [Paracoccaceae bacterium]